MWASLGNSFTDTLTYTTGKDFKSHLTPHLWHTDFNTVKLHVNAVTLGTKITDKVAIKLGCTIHFSNVWDLLDMVTITR